MDTNELIQYIIENEKIEHILTELGCHHIKSYTKEYRAGLPNYTTKNNLVVKKETLRIKVYQSDSNIITGNIFNLIMHIKEISFPKANKYLHELLGLEYNFDFKKHKEKKKEENNDPLAIFKKVKRKNCYVNLEDINLYDETIIKEYISLPHIDWIREGIMPWTCEVFKIGYSAEKKRIVIPIRYWCGNENEYLGIMGRTTIENSEIYDIPKYYPLKPFPKSINLYGLQENYKCIQSEGYCVVYESEKSPLKRHSRGDGTGVAIGSHNLSDEQVRILIGLNVDIIIAYDKDISLQHIRSECERFYGFRNIYYIYDKHDLLKEKESPADKPNKIFNYLLKHKVKYDLKEHREYLKSKEENNG